jgi:hypothetical protein
MVVALRRLTRPAWQAEQRQLIALDVVGIGDTARWRYRAAANAPVRVRLLIGDLGAVDTPTGRSRARR